MVNFGAAVVTKWNFFLSLSLLYSISDQRERERERIQCCRLSAE